MKQKSTLSCQHCDILPCFISLCWELSRRLPRRSFTKALRDFTINSLDHFFIVLFDWSIFIPLAAISIHRGFRDFRRKKKSSQSTFLCEKSYSLFFFCSVAEKRRKSLCNVTCLFHRWGWQVETHCYITIREAGSVVPSTLPSVSTTYCFSISRTRQLVVCFPLCEKVDWRRLLFGRFLTKWACHQRHPVIKN